MKRRSKTASLQKKEENILDAIRQTLLLAKKRQGVRKKVKKELGTYDRGAVKIYE